MRTISGISTAALLAWMLVGLSSAAQEPVASENTTASDNASASVTLQVPNLPLRFPAIPKSALCASARQKAKYKSTGKPVKGLKAQWRTCR